MSEQKQNGRPATDLVGQVFGRLTVLARAGNDGQRASLWRCACSCGNETLATGPRLRRGITQSCGCYRTERMRERIKAVVPPGHRAYQPGMVFGRLTLVEPLGMTEGRRTLWRCSCSCGGSIDLSSRRLHDGKHDCGCIKREKQAAKLAEKAAKTRKHPGTLCKIGATFGLLTIEEEIGKKWGGKLWRCSCACGGSKEVASSTLRKGDAKSCGCLRPGPKLTAAQERKPRRIPKAARMSIRPELRTADGSSVAPSTAPKRRMAHDDGRPAWKPQSAYKPMNQPAQRATGKNVTICPAPQFNHRYGVDPAQVPEVFSKLKLGQYLEVA